MQEKYKIGDVVVKKHVFDSNEFEVVGLRNDAFEPYYTLRCVVYYGPLIEIGESELDKMYCKVGTMNKQ